MHKISSIVYPGTFDPVTRSHSEIIRRTAHIFDSVTVAIAADTSKKTLFSLDDRVTMMDEEIKLLNIINVNVMPFNGLLVNFAAENNINVIVRGLRALSDFEYEFKMAYMNKKLKPSIETIFLPATEKENFISSSFVREIARLGGNVDEMVHSHVAVKLQQIFNT
jgi:pantetheine-phosphate adenylyltransferase